jgi:hypothetical protein
LAQQYEDDKESSDGEGEIKRMASSPPVISNFKQDKGPLYLEHQQDMKLVTTNKEVLDYQVTVSQWDIRQKFPAIIIEKKMVGTEAIDMNFSNDGSKILVLYKRKERDRMTVIDEEDGMEVNDSEPEDY